MKIEPNQFSTLFPFVFLSFGGSILIMGVLMVFLAFMLLIDGEDAEPFFVLGAGCIGLGFLIGISAYRIVRSLVLLLMLGVGCLLALTGTVVSIIASHTGDTPPLVYQILIMCVVTGLLLEYCGYRKLVKILKESESEIVRYKITNNEKSTY